MFIKTEYGMQLTGLKPYEIDNMTLSQIMLYFDSPEEKAIPLSYKEISARVEEFRKKKKIGKYKDT